MIKRLPVSERKVKLDVYNGRGKIISVEDDIIQWLYSDIRIDWFNYSLWVNETLWIPDYLPNGFRLLNHD